MSFITGKQIPRRTFLRGLGASVALPFLDAMIPAGTRARASADTRHSLERTRLVCIEEVHGLPGCNEWGAGQHLFAPATTGADFELLPDNALVSLKDFQDYLTIVSHTDVRMAEALSPPEIGGRSFPLERGVPDAVASQADSGLRHPRGNVARSDIRPALRPGYADALDAVLYRTARSGGRLYL